MRAAWWWIDRWRKSTAYTDMTAEEQGVYRNLLDELWLRNGVLPSEERVLAKISGDPEAWQRVRAKVLTRFHLTPEGYRNETHDEIAAWPAAQAKKGRKRAAQAVRKSGRFTSPAPAGAPAGAPAEDQPDPPAQHQPPSPSPSPYSVLRTPENGRNGEPPALPPADRIERTIRQTTDLLRTKLYVLVDKAVKLDPKGRGPTELMRLFTGYTKRDGALVGGVVNAAVLTFERLEKSIADAEGQIEEWKSG